MPTLYCKDENGYTEQLRFMFAETGIKYTEKHVTEEEMGDKLIFKQLPMVEWDNGFCLSESSAIIEYIASKADESGAGRGNTYLGTNALELNTARSFVHAANEFRRQLYELYILDGPAQDKGRFTDEVLPKWLARYNKLADQTDPTDLGIGPGVSFTFGDIAVFELLTQLISVFGSDVLTDYRELKEYYDRCAGRARFRMYIDNRPARSGLI